MRKFPLNLKNRVCPEIFHRIEYTFHHLNFWVTCAFPEKQRVPWNFSLYWIHFLHSGFLSKFAIGLKNSVCTEFFTVLNILFTFLIFEQLSLDLKNRVCPEIFHCIEYPFYIQELCATLRLPWKTECALNFFTLLNIFFTFRIF